MLKSKKVLFIIEELGDITTSAAIVNYNLCKIIAKEYSSSAILTLDNTSERIKQDWSNYGTLFMHPKENIKKSQKPWMYFNKIRALIYTILGNDFPHYNRIINIRKFLKNNIDNYDTLILMSGGCGFTPHQAIKNNKVYNTKNIISLYHDPYPISAYPVPYNTVKRWKEYFKFRNLQKTFSISNFVIFPSQRLYEWYLNDYEIDKKKVKIIPHAVDEILKLDIKEKDFNQIAISHTGTLLKPRNPKVFLEVFSRLKLKNTLVNFYGVINPFVFNDIKPFNDSKRINIFNERISYVESLAVLYKSDFLLLIESNGINNPFLPTKFVDYLNIEKPIIILSPEKSEVSRLVGSNYPFITSLDNEIGIKEIFTKINDKKNIEKALSILKHIKEEFSKESILNNYREII